MIEFMARYLGCPVPVLLSDVPFKTWEYERIFEDDLDVPVIGFNFPEKGLELNCDMNENVKSIFMHSDKFNLESVGESNSVFVYDRKRILEIFGVPSKSGAAIQHPTLGNRGAWDRFLVGDYVVHFRYRYEDDRIDTITLMTLDEAP